MTVQRDPQLIARIVEMRDAGMTRAQARFTLDMGEWKFRTILREHSLTNGWTRIRRGRSAGRHTVGRALEAILKARREAA